MKTTVKTCFKCGLKKPLCEFYTHKGMADGHLNKCKDCSRKDTRENREKNIVHYKLYDRKRASQPERAEQRKEWSRKWITSGGAYKASQRLRKAYPEKFSARGKVARAIATGKLLKQPCEICGATKVQAHHEDYSKPLDVIWLCSKHHRWIHQ